MHTGVPGVQLPVQCPKGPPNVPMYHLFWRSLSASITPCGRFTLKTRVSHTIAVSLTNNVVPASTERSHNLKHSSYRMILKLDVFLPKRPLPLPSTVAIGATPAQQTTHACRYLHMLKNSHSHFSIIICLICSALFLVFSVASGQTTACHEMQYVLLPLRQTYDTTLLDSHASQVLGFSQHARLQKGTWAQRL